MSADRKRKLALIIGVGAVAVVILVINNLSSRRRAQEARNIPQPVTITQPEQKPASDLLPLVSIGGQNKSGRNEAQSGDDFALEAESLARKLKLLQLRSQVVEAEQQLADLRVNPKAEGQRTQAVSLASQSAKQQASATVEQEESLPKAALLPGSRAGAYATIDETTPADSPKRFTLKQGTMLDAVLVNKLVTDNYESPVITMVDRPYYDPLTKKLLVPAGTRILGKAEAVKYQTASRLAITLDVFQFPNGDTLYVKPGEPALEGLGIFGAKDSVNRHTARILMTAGLVGILTGWNSSQVQSGAGYGTYSGTDMMRMQANESMSRTAEQMLSPFLNAMPTITVDEGHRLKVFISRDIPIDEYYEAPLE